MDRELADLARRLGAFRRQSRSSRPRYAGDLRAEVVAMAERAIGSGWSRQRVVDALGLSAPTLMRWMSQGEGRFRTVSIVEDDRATTSDRDAASIRVVTPSGWTIEGLDLDGVRELLEWAE